MQVGCLATRQIIPPSPEKIALTFLEPTNDPFTPFVSAILHK